MKIEIPNIGAIYPNEDSVEDRKMILEDDTDLLQINLLSKTDRRSSSITLDKSQMIQLRDALNVFFKSKLIE